MNTQIDAKLLEMLYFIFLGSIRVFIMIKITISFVLTCFFAFCVQGADGQPPATGKVPKFVIVGNSTNDLGKIPSYEMKTVRFRIKNTGDAPGEIIAFKPTCVCVSGTADKMHLGPQEEAEAQIILDSSLVHGGFLRSVWMETNDPAAPRILLALTGEVIPLFHGIPQSPQQINLAEGATWTNRFTLTATETNVFLGNPIVSTRTNKLSTLITIVTNTQGKTSFDVTLAVTALASGRHPLILKLPIEGHPKLSPIELTIHTRVGLELIAVPPKLMLVPTDQPLTRRMRLMISVPERSVDTNMLTWTPQREGVSVKVAHRPRNAYLTVDLTFLPEAVTKLLQEKDAQMTFHFPNYKSIRVDLVARPEPSADQTKAGKDP